MRLDDKWKDKLRKTGNIIEFSHINFLDKAAIFSSVLNLSQDVPNFLLKKSHEKAVKQKRRGGDFNSDIFISDVIFSGYGSGTLRFLSTGASKTSKI